MNGKPYTLIPPAIPDQQYDQATGRIVDGYQVAARWDADGAQITVFVPKGSDFEATADALIRHDGAQLDKLYGRTTTPAA